MDIDPHLEDTEDIEALQRGDDLALNRLMQRHRERLYHYLIRLLQDEAEALDLAQETFVRVYVNKHKLRSNQRFASWMYTIATNLARDRMRRIIRHPKVSLDAPVSTNQTQTLGDMLEEQKPGPGESLQAAERADEVKKALAALPEDLRTPLVLAEYEDLSQNEIADILSCTRKAVENRIYRARNILREKLQHLATCAATL